MRWVGLRHAARASAEVSRLLVERGANGNVGARYYGCALAVAREEGCEEMVG